MIVALFDSHYFPLNRAFKRKPIKSIAGARFSIYGKVVRLYLVEDCEKYTKAAVN